MRRFLKFWSLSRPEKKAFCEAGILLLLSYICVKTVPFRHIYSFLNAYEKRHVRTSSDSTDDVMLINLSLSRSANLLPWKSLCLSRSIVAFIMLRRRGIPAAMFVGVRFFEDVSLLAHAWINTDQGSLDSEDSAFTGLLRIGQCYSDR
jgi:Transglutaminase-like superfamily